jgi:hypothetical protein
MLRRILSGACVTLVVSGISCGDSGAPATPAAIQAVTPSVVAGTVGTSVAVTVRVTTANGGAVANANVSFAAGAGSGSAAPATVSTNASGEASSTWTLGTAPGTQSLAASVGSSLQVTFTAAATPGGPRSVTVQRQAPPVAVVGTDATPPPVFVVRDAHGNPVPGVTVSFTLRAGNGSFEPDSTVTDGQGQAAVERWTLGTTAGANTLAAHVAEVLTGTVTMNGTAAAPAVMASVAGHDQDGDIGAPVATPPAVQVHDAYGNPVQGAAVEFAVVEGGGSVAGAVQATNAAGVAAVASWTLGSAVGLNTLAATLPGLEPVVFTARAGISTFNLYIEAVHLNQASQTRQGSIGAVAGRPGLLRVIVRGTQLNQHAPPVRVRLYDGAALVREALIPAPRVGVPLNPDLADAGQTWNLQLPAGDVVAGLTVAAVVDPDGVIAEEDRDDNRFPRGAGTASLDVLPLAPLRVVFVPVHATVQNRTGNISSANVDAFLEDTRRWTPGNVVLPTIRSPYTTSLDLSVGDNWSRLVGEIQALRTAASATDEYYHGIVGAFPGTPWGGWAYIPGSPASLSRSGVTYDAFPTASRLLAHELGHNLGRRHAPCGNAAGIDQWYPHAGATLGSPGYDIVAGGIVAPDTHRDYMSYCTPQWASDYTYDGILQWRRNDPYARADDGAPAANAADGTEPTDGLLLWGRVQSGGATLNPAFSLRARPVLPETAGPHELRGLSADGAVVFRLSFAGVEVDHSDDPAERHFTFFVPLRPDEQELIERIELVTPRGSAARAAEAAMARAAPAPSDVRLEARPGNRVMITWDATRHPMVMVRDAETGDVLSIGRGGAIELPAGLPPGDRLQVLLSDGVTSRAW